MLGHFKDRNMLCLKCLSLDPVLDKPVFAAIYLAQPGDVLLFFEKHLSFFWRKNIWFLSILQLNHRGFSSCGVLSHTPLTGRGQLSFGRAEILQQGGVARQGRG